ncbi:MAG: hypothetical protein J7L15_05665, partial [Clostridiales bacterium]|nr:hypothetical protein [Clostridiales bacterium]
VLTLIGGMIMANAQDKPPLLDISSSQTPPILRIAPQPVSPAQSMPVSSRIPQEIVKNAPLAVITAQKAKKYLTPGKVWSSVGPRGEVEIKAAIIYDGIAVAVLHFNSSDGMLLPLGIHPVEIGVSPQVIEGVIKNVKRNLPAIVNSLEILNGAEYREPESVWCIPLAYKDMIVAHLKIYVDGIHIVPDYPANQEMQAYGK